MERIEIYVPEIIPVEEVEKMAKEHSINIRPGGDRATRTFVISCDFTVNFYYFGKAVGQLYEQTKNNP